MVPTIMPEASFFFKAAFGAGKLIFSIIFWPIIFILLFFGFFKILLPILAIGLVALFVIGIIRGATREDRNRMDRPYQPYQDQRSDYIDADYREIK